MIKTCRYLYTLNVNVFSLLQAQSHILPHCGGVDVHFNGVVDCFRQIVKIKGILSLWNGLTANLLKVTLFVCF